MSRFAVSPAARSDIRKIWDYTAENWSVRQADRYVTLIEDAFQRIAAGNVRGRSADEFRRGYLRLSIESHFIFYQLHASVDIKIMRVLHQRMNLPERLRDD
jgi:toxin ParE1/3/4